MPSAPRPDPQDGSVSLVPNGGVAGHFDVVAAGDVVGRASVDPLPGRESTGVVACSVDPGHRGLGYAHRALRLVIAHAFEQLAMHRVEAYLDADDRTAARLASRAGMRKEGILREFRPGHDTVLMARLASDPGPTTHEAFRAGLNAGLPRKRAIAQGLIRDDRGRVLMCELVYKRYWDLPGGVVDPDESPARTVVREIEEELGVRATVRGLAVVTWLPPWQGWDDATLFAFEATVLAGQWADSVLEAREIKAIHWCDDEALEQHAAAYTTRLVRRAVRQIDAGSGTAYLEDGRDPDW